MIGWVGILFQVGVAGASVAFAFAAMGQLKRKRSGVNVLFLKLIELKKQFLVDLRQMDNRTQAAARVSAGDSPPRHFASATRALQRAVDWYQYLVANNL